MNTLQSECMDHVANVTSNVGLVSTSQSQFPPPMFDLERMTTAEDDIYRSHERESAACSQCFSVVDELFLDATDMNCYCERCWIHHYGSAPVTCMTQPLVQVEGYEIWTLENLQVGWKMVDLPGWPPVSS